MAFSIANNTPSAGHVQWSDVNIQYKGISYAVSDGYTNYRYIYWLAANPSQFFVSDTFPTLTPDDALVFMNKNGVALIVPSATIIDGGLVVPGSIYADAIAANAITSDKIAANAITTNKIAANAIGADQIAAAAVSADKMVAGTITAASGIIADAAITNAKIANLDAGKITTGTLDAARVTIGASSVFENGYDPSVASRSGLHVVAETHTPMNYGSYHAYTDNLGHVIEVTEDIHIGRVKVYSQEAQTIGVFLKPTQSGIWSYDKSFDLIAGENIINLDMILLKSWGSYGLYVKPHTVGLWRNTSASYPYEAGSFSIVGSTLGNTYFYYFYDIEIAGVGVYGETNQKDVDAVQTNLATLQNSLGSLAYDDAVEVAKLGTTIIEGGYFKTGLVDASRIDTGTLNAARISIGAASSFASGYDPSTKETPADAQAKADAAQAAAILVADAAQDAADAAQADATSALSTLADIYADAKVTPDEKQMLKLEWDTIVAEKTVNDAQADTFGITTEKTTYGTKYSALNTYVNTTYPLFTNLSTTTTIDSGATLRTKFKEYYDARTALLNAIAAKAKTLADDAQSAADDAQDTADTAITNAATAQTTANGKNKVFYQDSAPTATAVGDTWFDTNDGNKAYKWDGSDWVASLFGTNAIADASITTAKIGALQVTDALIANGTISNAKIASLNAGKITAGKLQSADEKTYFDLDNDEIKGSSSDTIDFLISESVLSQGTLSTSTGLWSDNSAYGVTGYYEIVPSSSVSVTGTVYTCYKFFYDATKSFISYSSGNPATAPATAKYVRLRLYNAGAAFTSWNSNVEGTMTIITPVSFVINPTDGPQFLKGEEIITSIRHGALYAGDRILLKKFVPENSTELSIGYVKSKYGIWFDEDADAVADTSFIHAFDLEGMLGIPSPVLRLGSKNIELVASAEIDLLSDVDLNGDLDVSGAVEIGGTAQITGQLTMDFNPKIKGTATGTSNTAYMQFMESNNTTRQGYFGFGSPSTNNLTINNEIGDLYLTASGGDINVGSSNIVGSTTDTWITARRIGLGVAANSTYTVDAGTGYIRAGRYYVGSSAGITQSVRVYDYALSRTVNMNFTYGLLTSVTLA